MAANKESNPIPYNVRIKIIRERLNRARRAQVTSLPKPAKVKAAEKIVSEWEEKEDAHRQAQYDKHREKVREIENAVLLGDNEKVVKLLTDMGV
jgi:hypothetical protein